MAHTFSDFFGHPSNVTQPPRTTTQTSLGGLTAADPTGATAQRDPTTGALTTGTVRTREQLLADAERARLEAEIRASQQAARPDTSTTAPAPTPLSAAEIQNQEQRAFLQDQNRTNTFLDSQRRQQAALEEQRRAQLLQDVEAQRRFQTEQTGAQQRFQTGEREGAFANQQTQDVNRTGLQTGFRQGLINQLPGIVSGVRDPNVGGGGTGGTGGPFPVSGSGGAGGGGGAGTTGGGGLVGGGGASAATAGRAQERIGLATQGALRGLEGALTSRGLSGPIEGAAVGNVLATGLQQRGEADRDQSLADQARANAVADRNFAGNLALRRGQQQQLGPILGLLSGGGANLF